MPSALPGLARIGAEASTDSAQPWAVHVGALHGALARHDIARAIRAREAANRAAEESRSWEGALAVAEATLRLGDAQGARAEVSAEARRLCLAGLYRARARRSADGVLRAAEALAALGDEEVAEHGLRIAQALAVDGGADVGLTRSIREARQRIARAAPSLGGGAAP